MVGRIVIAVFVFILFIVFPLKAQDSTTLYIPLFKPAPATDVVVEDVPNDAGEEIEIRWDLSVDDFENDGRVSRYFILRSEDPAGDYDVIGITTSQDNAYTNKETEDGVEYYYKVVAFPFTKFDDKLTEAEISRLLDKLPVTMPNRDSLAIMLSRYSPQELLAKDVGLENKFAYVNPLQGMGAVSFAIPLFDLWQNLAEGDPYHLHTMKTYLMNNLWGDSEVNGPVKSKAHWFNFKDLDTFIIGMVICLSVVVFITMARGGKELFLRRIGGLQAIDEAIGRATEMGKSILFIPGINDMDDVQTVAGITILGRIAKTIAEYDTRINMPVSRSIVMTTARETIKEAYMSAGRPDAYSDEMVHYLTDEQFGYVAAVDGIMVREKPATCFYLGAFFAESLIMAETGNSIGAIQIAGTAMPAQLPFFVAACDYTLIGEELFAASAYLSGEPKQLGSLKGQDVGKVIAVVFIAIGVIFSTLAVLTGSDVFVNLSETLKSWFTA